MWTKTWAAGAAACLAVCAWTGTSRADDLFRLRLDRLDDQPTKGVTGHADVMTLQLDDKDDADTIAIRHGGWGGGRGWGGGGWGRGWGGGWGRGWGWGGGWGRGWGWGGWGRGWGWGGWGRGWGWGLGGWPYWGWGGGWGWPYYSVGVYRPWYGSWYPASYYPASCYWGNATPVVTPSTTTMVAASVPARTSYSTYPTSYRSQRTVIPTPPPDGSPQALPAPPAPQPDATYPYDGGPPKPVPMPQKQTQPAPQGKPADGYLTQLRAKPTEYVYRAYGEKAPAYDAVYRIASR